MKKILIIGAGAMGAAFTFPCTENNHKVTLTEPYNTKLLKTISAKKKFHPSLKINLPKKLVLERFSIGLLKQRCDLIVIAVSSIGMDLIKENLKYFNFKSRILILTKGLKYDAKAKKILTMSEQLNQGKNKFNLSVLKGPCLAKELARKIISSTIIANKNINIAKSIGCLLYTSPSPRD